MIACFDHELVTLTLNHSYCLIDNKYILESYQANVLGQKQTDRHTDKHTHGQIHMQTDFRTHRVALNMTLERPKLRSNHPVMIYMRKTLDPDEHTDRHTYGQTHTWTDRHADGH